MTTDRKTNYGSFNDDEETVPLMRGEDRHITHSSPSGEQHTFLSTTWSRLFSGDLTAIFMQKLEPLKEINAREHGKMKETLPVVAIHGELVGEGKPIPQMEGSSATQSLMNGDVVAILRDKDKAPNSVDARANKKKQR